MLTRMFFGSLMAFLVAAQPVGAEAGQSDGKLDVYFIDAEGGAATLIVTPAGESVLVDTGNPGERDAGRIFAAAQAADIMRINHVVVTHYHVDHLGGLSWLSTLMPVQYLHDNADENATRDRPSPEYLKAKVESRALMNPGDVLPLRQREDGPKLSIQCLAAHRKFIDPPAGAKPNPLDKDSKPKAEDTSDNANSIVLLVSFGDFKFLDCGDLTWNMEHELAAPVNRIGTVDVFQVTHHGLSLSNNPVLVKAIEPTVAVMNNGATKGCEPEVFATLKSTPSIKAIFQLHKNLRPDGSVNNTEAQFIANQERRCQGNLIHMAVDADAKKYTVSIPATKFEQNYSTKHAEP